MDVAPLSNSTNDNQADSNPTSSPSTLPTAAPHRHVPDAVHYKPTKGEWSEALERSSSEASSDGAGAFAQWLHALNMEHAINVQNSKGQSTVVTETQLKGHDEEAKPDERLRRSQAAELISFGTVAGVAVLTALAVVVAARRRQQAAAAPGLSTPRAGGAGIGHVEEV